MPDFERIADELKIKVAKERGEYKGKSADYWDGYRNGKSYARWTISIVFAVVYFSIAAIGHYYT